jgi:hypothetical protein
VRDVGRGAAAPGHLRQATLSIKCLYPSDEGLGPIAAWLKEVGEASMASTVVAVAREGASSAAGPRGSSPERLDVTRDLGVRPGPFQALLRTIIY